ncbi:MAG: DNA polymerase III subunit gamma/tau, partial [Clostridia bacterium]
MTKALYRKWRPLTFDDVYGQEHITTTLKNEIKSQKFSHAYLFTGSRGTGKTSCSKILAKSINCLNSHNGNPCLQCENCIKIANDETLDVIEIDAASNNGVDNIRQLREEALYTPSVCKYRVYIIDETHMLSQGAFNALLKIMEEPPAHVVFILATTEVHKVPAT